MSVETLETLSGHEPAAARGRLLDDRALARSRVGETTAMYLQAVMQLEESALAKTAATDVQLRATVRPTKCWRF